MELFLTIEAQNANESGLADILREINQKLSFVTEKNIGLQDLNNYGTEFRIISIIPSCVEDSYWNALGWKERVQIWRTKKEADIRLRINYEQFMREGLEKKRLMFVGCIVKSIQILVEKSKEDFDGNKLIKDIVESLGMTQEQIENIL